MNRSILMNCAARVLAAALFAVALSTAEAWACGCPCDADADCHDGDRCNLSTGFCQTPSDECAVDADCNDGLFCNGVETCDIFAGCKPGAVPCDDGVACTVDVCDEVADSCDCGPSNAACDDGIYCNGAETCDVQLGCLGASPIDCSASDDFCGAGACDEEAEGCVLVPQNDGSDCGAHEGDVCVLSSVCASGACLVTPLCDEQCERCDPAGCASLCGNPWGNANDDVNSTDALFALRAAVELEQCNLCICDVDGDGTITATDTLMMLRHIVGLGDLFVCSPSAGPDETATTTTLPVP